MWREGVEVDFDFRRLGLMGFFVSSGYRRRKRLGGVRFGIC